jgi:cell division protein FtsZ
VAPAPVQQQQPTQQPAQHQPAQHQPTQHQPTQAAQQPPRQVTFDEGDDLDVPDFLK